MITRLQSTQKLGAAQGNLESGADESGFAFTAREWDPEVGLYYYRARYYDPQQGRFLSEDPLGFGGGVNYYAYVENGPTTRIDPLGLKSSIADWINLIVALVRIGSSESKEESEAIVKDYLTVADRIEELRNPEPGTGLGCSLGLSGMRLRSQLTAMEVAFGHAFEKHVLQQGEFQGLGIRTRAQFMQHVENVVSNPTDVRYASDGRTYFLHEGTSTIVIRNPGKGESTAFQPDNWTTYVGLLPKATTPPK